MGGRVHPYGLLGDGMLHNEIHCELNTGNVVAFLRSIMGMVAMLDNAPFHKGRKFKRFAGMGDDLILAYLPRTRPGLTSLRHAGRCPGIRVQTSARSGSDGKAEKDHRRQRSRSPRQGT